MSSKKPRTNTAKFEKGLKEPFLRASDRPIVKLLNWYPGFGKTHTADAFISDLLANSDVTPVLIAPLKTLWQE